MNQSHQVGNRRAMSMRTMLIYTVLIQFVTIIALVVVGIGYVQRQTQKICGMIVLLDSPLPPNATARQRQFADALHRYRQDIGCKEPTK
jgi:hypothetical protein